MKEVVSVSLGSSRRDHHVELDILGKRFKISRIGTDGDMKKAKKLLESLDGKVAAIGLGGIDLYLYAGNNRYAVRDARKLISGVKTTPVVDGSGLKNTLERQVIRELQNEQETRLTGKKVLMVSAVDRFGMAEALCDVGAQMTFGDLVFGLGIPVVIHSFKVFKAVARMVLPVAVRLPFEVLYPTGSKQEEKPKEKYAHHYHDADVIAGDFLFVRKFMPEDMRGKVIITNTVTAGDMEDLRRRGVQSLITTTPELEGRCFGTNVMEALFVAILDKPLDQIVEEDYIDLMAKIGFQGHMRKLN